MIKVIRTVIVEDEKPAMERLDQFLGQTSDVDVIARADNGKDAIQLINTLRPDLVILDINLPIKNGFEILEEVAYIPALIFTTAYDKYAVKAFEYHAVDYLLKPFNRDRFNESISRIRDGIKNGDPKKSIERLLDYMNKSDDFLTKITVKADYVYKIVEVKDIQFIRSDEGLINIYTKNNRYCISKTLTQLQELLDPRDFFRVRRNCIVNLHKIVQVVPWGRNYLSLKMENQESIQVGKDNITRFKKIMTFL